MGASTATSKSEQRNIEIRSHQCGVHLYVEHGGEKPIVFCGTKYIGTAQWDARSINNCPECQKQLRFEDTTLVQALS